MDRSLSPWAWRYPGPKTLGILPVENTYHSLLRPKFPDIVDPKYYDRYPQRDADHPPKDYAEKDSVFHSEKIQRRCLWGAETWQVAALNRRLCIPSTTDLMFGGHQKRPLREVKRPRTYPQLPGEPSWISYEPKPDSDDFAFYQSHRIEVNETRWLPFLRKDRWFDLIRFAPDETQSRPDKPCSVDDPQLWEALKVSLELVDRIFKALLQDKHDCVVILRTILYGRIDYWSKFEDIFGDTPSEDASVLITSKGEQNIRLSRMNDMGQWDPFVNYSAEQWADRLVKLLSKTIWGLEYHSDAHAATTAQPLVDNINRSYTSIITLRFADLDGLLNPDLVLGELCILQVQLAITIVHEIGHAILFGRTYNDDYIGNFSNKIGSDGIPIPEPYIDGAGYREVGYFMEQNLFGGVHQLRQHGHGLAII
ncbi:hypothetical protein F4803DRAFT_576844 [Xylaria telfairii]|nr:hypothetical protein F4803DRAFT_576844 [Xylaria telfairii]